MGGRLMFGAVRNRTTPKQQAPNRPKDAKNKPVIFPKLKTVHLRQETINERGLSCPIPNSIVVGIDMPANHPFMVSHNPNLKMSTKSWDRYKVVKATLGPQGFNISAPALPFNIIALTQTQINEDNELSELKKHNGLYETASAIVNALGDIDESAEPAVAHKVFSELSPLLEQLNEIDAEKSTNWNDLLVKPGDDSTHHTGVMKFEGNTLLMKLMFPNYIVYTLARAALLCWNCAIENLQDTNNELESLTTKYRAMAKSRKEKKKEADGWNKHTNKKHKANRKTESELWAKIEKLAKEDASINIHSDKIAESVTTNRVWVDHYQERFVSVELRNFDQSSFDVMNLRECNMMQGILQAADIGDENMHEITYLPCLDPREAKVYIILPEPHINVLLCAIMNESPNEKPICEVRASVIDPNNRAKISVNILEGYKSAREALQPAVAEQAVDEHKVEEDGDLQLDDSQLENMPQLKPVIVTYASIINHASIKVLKTTPAAKPNKPPTPPQSNVAVNNAPKTNTSDIAALEQKITAMMSMISDLQEENKQLRKKLSNQLKEPKQSSNNTNSITDNVENVTAAIKAAMQQQAVSINKRFDDLSMQLQSDAEENTKKLEIMVKKLVRKAIKSDVQDEESSSSRKRQCVEQSHNDVRHNQSQSINQSTNDHNMSSDESDADSLAH
ncbi:hypothetical protein HDU85_001028 [Gaertneriomyces sp. JEL0708]|nr:hypothetical protein HDU85_001028 [Gaertneriomyces sp. JEL0708]